jgi:hypothetical protein
MYKIHLSLAQSVSATSSFSMTVLSFTHNAVSYLIKIADERKKEVTRRNKRAGKREK